MSGISNVCIDYAEAKKRARSERFFWAKYIESTGKISKNKNGQAGNNARNRRLSAAASFYKAMALKKVGSKITIPQRQFLGFHPSLIEPIEEIAGRKIKEYLHETLPNKH